jgi:hypothetical protein
MGAVLLSVHQDLLSRIQDDIFVLAFHRKFVLHDTILPLFLLRVSVLSN